MGRHTVYDKDGDVEMESPGDLGFVEFTKPDESELHPQASRTFGASGDFFTDFKLDITTDDHSTSPLSYGWTAYERVATLTWKHQMMSSF